jgi:ABC-type transport system involved in multi-copper enzyme maturation permease subunit
VIARFLAFPLLELKTCWKRPLNIIMLGVFGLMSFGFVAGGVQVSAGSADTGGAKVAINSAFNIAFSDILLFALILPFFIAVSCGMPVLGDFDRRINRLISATPMSHGEYAFSRFLGSLSVVAAVLGLWLLVQIGIYELYPIDPNERTRGAFSLWHYLYPVLVSALPLSVFIGGVSMWLGVRSRQPVLVFALPVVVVITGLFFVWTFNPSWLPVPVDKLMQFADPTGVRWLLRTFVDEDRGVVFYNTQPFAPARASCSAAWRSSRSASSPCGRRAGASRAPSMTTFASAIPGRFSQRLPKALRGRASPSMPRSPRAGARPNAPSAPPDSSARHGTCCAPRRARCCARRACGCSARSSCSSRGARRASARGHSTPRRS